MSVKNNKIIPILLFLLLVGLSFLKDDFSPDFRNSSGANFLSPVYHVSRITSLSTQSLFWFVAILYSALFIILPYLIIHFYFSNPLLSKFTLVTLSVMCGSIYLMIFMNVNTLDLAIIPKINRYFHSPIIVMFFIAAFTIISRGNLKE